MTCVGITAAIALGAATGGVDFDRHIRPLLSDRCYQCHGPDAAARQAGMRLDRRDGAMQPRGRRPAVVVPGDPDASLLIRRITETDPDDRMPPSESNKTLAPHEIDLLRQWIAEGASWSEHWAFEPPAPTEPPDVFDDAWPRNGIDRFVLRRLEAEGLFPSPDASRETLLRRVTLDLTGLPPTLQEMNDFLGDERPDAYERVVDRLLDSPHYGERMAMAWLDLARYADTHGYHYDNERTMWPWRDWLIDAYNRNVPFDELTTLQLAGDLLPDATAEQRMATGFNRNHGISWEGGIIPEEYQVEYVVDRVVTTSTAWLGLTMGCARCHDHKFDPVSQAEFYSFAAFFNTIPEKGLDGLEGNATPLLRTPDPDRDDLLAELDGEIAGMQAEYDAPDPELDATRQAWAKGTAATWRAAWTVLEPFSFHSAGGAELSREDDGSIFAGGRHPDVETYEIVAFTPLTGIRALRLEAMTDERLPEGGPGRAFHANIVLSELEVEAAPIDDAADDPSAAVAVEWLTAHADHSQPNFHVRKAIDGQRTTGWALNGARYGEDRVAIFVPAEPIGFAGGTALKIRVRQDSDYLQHAIGRLRLSVTTDDTLGERLRPSGYGPWRQLGPFPADNGKAAHTTDFGPEAAFNIDTVIADWAVREDIADGVVATLPEDDNSATYLHRTIDSPDARDLTLSFGSDDAIKAWLNGDLVLESDAPRGAAPDQNVVQVRLRKGVNDLLVKVANYGGGAAFYFDPRNDHGLDEPLIVLGQLHRSEAERNEHQQRDLRDHWLKRNSPRAGVLLAELSQRKARRAEIVRTIPTVMVMQEMDTPQRDTHVLMRGRYDMPGDKVTAAVPSVLGALPDDRPRNRLGLAQWLTEPSHPLTARVAVNRYWQMHFGRGLVETAEDFGVQGSRPSHPALLDWLAARFVADGWDIKAMHRLMVTSSTYRQSAQVTETHRQHDPSNLLLARGPRFRLRGEVIRDQALAVSGLLVPTIGGPPVKPYQPDGLWKEVGSEVNAFSANEYRRDTGDKLYRRSLYTFWKRTLPPPTMTIFDAPTREFCVARRSRTNTPLQALVLLNDPTYVEAARFLAQRALVEGGTALETRAELMFRVVTGRRPTSTEREVVLGLYEEQWQHFADSPDAVRALLGVGEGVHPAELDRVELAAWAVVAATLLNLDEVITRG